MNRTAGRNEAGDCEETIRRQAERIAELESLVDSLRQESQQAQGEADAAKGKIEELRQEIERLKELLHGKAESKESKKPKFTENYGLTAHEAKQPGKRKSKRGKNATGRRPKQVKESQIQLEFDIYPEGVNHKKCVRRRQQCAWRIIDGKAVYVRYNIYAPPKAKKLPLPEGLRNSRSEYGVEIILYLAFLHYWIGDSLDKCCEIFHAFTGLVLSKSQADSLLGQLATDWSEDYDAILTLIAYELIVYVDETGWKIGKHSCYTWIFTTARYVIFRCGVGRGKEEAQKVLGAKFGGIGVSDDYAAYKDLFNEHQLCWAHLLRKAIKLALTNPGDTRYAQFLDDLYAIYCQAVRYQKDRRLKKSRSAKVAELEQAIRDLCTLAGRSAKEAADGAEETLIKLQNELVDNLECLFVFVLHPQVERTNNTSERNARHEAEVRKGGRTSKTESGARRRSIVLTVFASLRTRMKLTMRNVIAEVQQWRQAGRSIFRRELDKLLESIGQPRAAPAPAA